MSWMQKLYQTYEFVQKKEFADNDQPSLTPVGHTLQTAHIEMVLDGAGHFKTARVLPPKTTIMLPVTEASENRTSGEAPHPLADKIQYVAKDYADYGGGKKPYFDGYLKQLQAWCDSSAAHPKVQAVLRYVSQGTVVADLVRAGVLPLADTGKVAVKWEAEGEAPPIFSVLPRTKGEIEFGSALVCWCVEMAGDVHSQTWTDKTIQQSWVDYLNSSETQKGFCLITGEEEAAIASMHPAKLRHTGDKAKLISSNDTGGYTFRGRFETAEEAASVSAEVSAKAHGALRWLIARQGVRNGEQVTVAWAIHGEDVPSPLQDMYAHLANDDDDDDWLDGDQEATPSSESAPSEHSAANKDWAANVGRDAAVVIKRKLHGKLAELKNHEQISLLMLDSATPGRMALTYYQEFLPEQYLKNLDAWVDDFSWYQRYSEEQSDGKKKTKRTTWLYLPPSPAAIAHTVYGKSLSDALKKQLYARLLPVIANGSAVPVPYDLVQQSFQAACNPHGCEHWEWQRNIGVACALYKGWRARHCDSNLKRVFTMDLEKENVSRDYLFGRLLAVLEKIESKALQLAGETRATNAERYMQRFVSKPLSTWLQLRESLEPYQARLRNNRYAGFLANRQKELDEIGAALNQCRENGVALDERLDGEFLLGYHSQQMAYRQQFNNQSEQDETPSN